ncbi:hypothetical protein BGZ76_010822 [Entomortierella beljakovae]|nr:hypothetical protein BGZ76_010822 [Entomortierella beljakovae]
MNRNHSYTKVSGTGTDDDHSHNPSASSSGSNIFPVMLAKLPRLPSSSSGYSKLLTEDTEDTDEKKVATSMSSSPDSVRIDMEPQPEASSSNHPTTTSSTSEAPNRPQFPAAAGARKIIQQTMDGVFSNLSAKPRSYKVAERDSAPVYDETATIEDGLVGDEVLVDGLLVGSSLGLIWSLLLSAGFQFLGFFLTYILHTSHTTKAGSKIGLGLTFISLGQQMLVGDEEPDMEADTGYMGDTGPSTRSNEYFWVSYTMTFLGAVLILHSSFEFLRVKLAERAILVAAKQDEEASISNEPETQASTPENPHVITPSMFNMSNVMSNMPSMPSMPRMPSMIRMFNMPYISTTPSNIPMNGTVSTPPC